MKLIRTGLILMSALAAGALVAANGAKPSASAKADEAPVEIKGVEIPRPAGGFLGLEIVGNNFVLSFYDAQKSRTPVDVARAALRWPVRYQPGDERLVLSPGGDGTVLTSARIIRPPHHFRVAIALFVEGNNDPVEFYNVDFP